MFQVQAGGRNEQRRTKQSEPFLMKSMQGIGKMNDNRKGEVRKCQQQWSARPQFLTTVCTNSTRLPVLQLIDIYLNFGLPNSEALFISRFWSIPYDHVKSDHDQKVLVEQRILKVSRYEKQLIDNENL
jgi:hypothetical protein